MNLCLKVVRFSIMIFSKIYAFSLCRFLSVVQNKRNNRLKISYHLCANLGDPFFGPDHIILNVSEILDLLELSTSLHRCFLIPFSVTVASQQYKP